MMFERVLKGGTIIDGTGKAGYVGDIAFDNGKIAAIGHGLQGREELSVTGYTVTPGFIDIHRHGDAEVFREGFGSLDSHSLDQAYRTLNGLTEGHRLVGIISHVTELKERIHKQIVVKKTKEGSSQAVIQVDG